MNRSLAFLAAAVATVAMNPKHPFNAAEGSDGCWLLIEAIYK